MKNIVAIAFITLLAVGTGCAWISPPSQTTSDGIKVHGDWTITITNPDGTVASVQEFSNELHPISNDRGNGPAIMTALLAGETSIDPTGWHISFYANANIQCQNSQYYDANKFTWYNNASMPATIIREPLPGSPLMISMACTLALENPAVPARIHTVYSTAGLETIFESHGYTGTWTAQNRSPTPITEKTIQPADQVDIYHNQVIGFNVLISFE